MGLRGVLASLASPGIFMAKWVYGQSASKGRCVETSGTLEPVETSTGLHGETKSDSGGEALWVFKRQY